jgi:mono/diheme cytochrome c family protein
MFFSVTKLHKTTTKPGLREKAVQFTQIIIVQARLAVPTILLASSIGIVVLAQGNPDAARIKNPVAVTAESVAAGKQVYQRYCASCHGLNAEGGSGSDISPPAPDLTDSEWKRGSTDGEIFDVIKNGVPPDLNMEPWGDRINDTNIWNVVNYVRSLAKKK